MIPSTVARLPASPPGYGKDDGFVRLHMSERPFPLTEEETADLARTLATLLLGRHPDPAHTAVERQIATLIGLDPTMTLAGNGTRERLELLVPANCDPGDEVLTGAPTHHRYDRLYALGRARPVPVPRAPGCRFPHARPARGWSSPASREIESGTSIQRRRLSASPRPFPALGPSPRTRPSRPATGSRPSPGVVRAARLCTPSKAYGAAGLRFGHVLRAVTHGRGSARRFGPGRGPGQSAVRPRPGPRSASVSDRG